MQTVTTIAEAAFVSATARRRTLASLGLGSRNRAVAPVTNPREKKACRLSPASLNGLSYWRSVLDAAIAPERVEPARDLQL